jgi:hypothetical protein
MTASKTPNLALMSPVLSDPFSPDDFADTFSKLDLAPGITVILNQASRPTGLGAAQHGRMYWQADQNIVWVWVQPSSMVAGAWSRVGTKGWLGGAANAAQVNTTAISVNTAPTIVNVNTLIPGGRPVLVLYRWTFIGNDQARYATINLLANSSSVQEALRRRLHREHPLPAPVADARLHLRRPGRAAERELPGEAAQPGPGRRRLTTGRRHLLHHRHFHGRLRAVRRNR